MFVGKAKLEIVLAILGVLLTALGISDLDSVIGGIWLQLILFVLPVGLLSCASGMALADLGLAKPMVFRTPRLLIASIAISLLVPGAVLCRFVMLGGLLGLPLSLVGAVLCLLFALSISGHQVAALKQAAGITLILLGLATLFVGNLWTALTVGDIMLARQRELSVPWSVSQWLIPCSWLIAPTFITFGVKQRGGCVGKMCLGLWLYWLSYFLLTIMGVMIGSWMGWALSA